MWEFEHRETSNASRRAIWRLWSDVGSWPTWDSGIEWVELDGPFAPGTEGRLKPSGSKSVAFRLLDARPDEGFVDETKLPLARMRFQHELSDDATSGAIQISHRVSIRGPLAPFFARVIGRDLARDMPATVRSLARAAESMEGTAAA